MEGRTTMILIRAYWGDGEYKRVILSMENIGAIEERNENTVVIWLRTPIGDRKCLEVRESFDTFLSNLE